MSPPFIFMPNKNQNKRCPKCGHKIDIVGTCKKCGRPWSETLEEGETAIDNKGQPLPEGQQYDALIVSSKPPRLKAEKKAHPFSDDLLDSEAWNISPQDTEIEIHRKRSLLHLNSRTIYNAMGTSTKAFEAQKSALLWLSRFHKFVPEEEQTALIPIIAGLKSALGLLTLIRNAKVSQAVKMEKAMEKVYSQIRKTRLKDMKKATKVTLPEQDSEGLGLSPVEIDPKLLLQQAEEQLLALDIAKTKAKNKAKEKKRKDVNSNQDSE